MRALRDLEQAGEFELPARVLDINKSWKPRRLPHAVADPEGVPWVVDEVRGLRVELVDPKDGAGMRTWNERTRWALPRSISAFCSGSAGTSATKRSPLPFRTTSTRAGVAPALV